MGCSHEERFGLWAGESVCVRWQRVSWEGIVRYLGRYSKQYKMLRSWFDVRLPRWGPLPRLLDRGCHVGDSVLVASGSATMITRGVEQWLAGIADDGSIADEQCLLLIGKRGGGVADLTECGEDDDACVGRRNSEARTG